MNVLILFFTIIIYGFMVYWVSVPGGTHKLTPFTVKFDSSGPFCRSSSILNSTQNFSFILNLFCLYSLSSPPKPLSFSDLSSVVTLPFYIPFDIPSVSRLSTRSSPSGKSRFSPIVLLSTFMVVLDRVRQPRCLRFSSERGVQMSPLRCSFDLWIVVITSN